MGWNHGTQSQLQANPLLLLDRKRQKHPNQTKRVGWFLRRAYLERYPSQKPVRPRHTNYLIRRVALRISRRRNRQSKVQTQEKKGTWARRHGPRVLFEMGATGLWAIRDIFNQWWFTQEIPQCVLRTWVIMLQKLPSYLNYRPISLLNTFCKMFTAIIKHRIEAEIEHKLHNTQYGFRKNRATNDAILIVCKMSMSERGGRKHSLILIDWEKTFNNIYHIGFFFT